MANIRQDSEAAQPPGEPPASWKAQIMLLLTPGGLLRVFAYMAVAHLLTIVLLGLLFDAILVALTPVFIRLAVVFTPAYHLAGRLMGAQRLPARLARPPTWFTIYSAVYMLICLAAAGILTRALFAAGFCKQNLICIAAYALSR